MLGLLRTSQWFLKNDNSKDFEQFFSDELNLLESEYGYCYQEGFDHFKIITKQCARGNIFVQYYLKWTAARNTFSNLPTSTTGRFQK